MQLVSDNLHVINPAVAAALDQYDPGPIQDLVKKCEAAGAQAIDINSGPLTRAPEKKMAFLVEAVQAVSRLPLLLDTSNPKAIKAGLEAAKSSKKPPIINGFSLESKKIETILPLAKKYHTPIVGYLLTPNSQVPVDEADLISVALELYEKFHAAGLADDQLIIDPVVAPVIWENGVRHNQSVISIIRKLPDLLGFPVKTIAGISNLTTGKIPLGKKQLLEQAFVPVLMSAGLSMALVDVFHQQTMKISRACHALLDKGVFSWAAL